MSTGDESAPRRPSVITAFAMMPLRTMWDRGLRSGDKDCLQALCWLVDPATGLSVSTQDRIRALTGRPRSKVPGFLDNLEYREYVEKIKRGRQPGGPVYKTLVYKILYDAADFDVLRGRDSGRFAAEAVTPQGGQTRDPPGGSVSMLPDIKLKSGASIFEAVAATDLCQQTAQVARQLELPYSEVQYFDLLYQRASKMLGFRRIVELDLTIRRETGKRHGTRGDYHRALIARLEELTTEAPVGAGKVQRE